MSERTFVCNKIKSIGDSAVLVGQKVERIRILSAIDHLIHDTEDCPLYEGEERFWMLSAYRNVRRLINAVDQDISGGMD